MYVAIANGGLYDGVIIKKTDAQIYYRGIPIDNYSEMLSVEEKYRIIDGEQVREMTAEEKAIVDSINLEVL